MAYFWSRLLFPHYFRFVSLIFYIKMAIFITEDEQDDEEST